MPSCYIILHINFTLTREFGHLLRVSRFNSWVLTLYSWIPRIYAWVLRLLVNSHDLLVKLAVLLVNSALLLVNSTLLLVNFHFYSWSLYMKLNWGRRLGSTAKELFKNRPPFLDNRKYFICGVQGAATRINSDVDIAKWIICIILNGKTGRAHGGCLFSYIAKVMPMYPNWERM
jgi:hypothetical protein